MTDDIILHEDVKFVQAQDQENVIRAMHTEIYKAHHHTPSDRILAVLEFHECGSIEEAIERYDKHIEEGVLVVIDEQV